MCRREAAATRGASPSARESPRRRPPTERRRASFATLRERGAERRRPHGPEIRLAAHREQHAEQSLPPLPRRPDDRSAVAEGGDCEPVAAPRSDVPERDRRALGHVPLAPVGGAERHRRGGVEQDPRHERPLGDEGADVRDAGSGRHVPVDQPHVVGRLVRPHLGELGAFAERASAVIAGEQSVDPAAHRDVEPPERRRRHRPRAGTGRRALGTEKRRRRSCDHRLRELLVRRGHGLEHRIEDRVRRRRPPRARRS